jgi:hypothetical protein
MTEVAEMPEMPEMAEVSEMPEMAENDIIGRLNHVRCHVTNFYDVGQEKL